MNVNLFVLQYPSAQIFTNNCFCKVLFQARTEAGSPALQADFLPTKLSGKPFFQTQCNLVMVKKIDKVKVCGESHFFSPSVHRPRYLWTWQTLLPVCRSDTGTSYYVYVLPGAQRHWTLSLRQNWAHLSRGFCASCRSPVCSGCSWPSPSLVGSLPSLGASVWGERTAHRHGVLHRDLGRKGGLGKSKCLRISVWFFFLET